MVGLLPLAHGHSYYIASFYEQHSLCVENGSYSVETRCDGYFQTEFSTEIRYQYGTSTRSVSTGLNQNAHFCSSFWCHINAWVVDWKIQLARNVRYLKYRLKCPKLNSLKCGCISRESTEPWNKCLKKKDYIFLNCREVCIVCMQQYVICKGSCGT